MPKVMWITFFILMGLQITTLIPIKSKIRWQLFTPLATLPLYIWHESYFLRPEVLATIPIRIDLLVLHPLIIVAFIYSICRLLYLSRKENRLYLIGVFIVLTCFVYWWYHILVICKFYLRAS